MAAIVPVSNSFMQGKERGLKVNESIEATEQKARREGLSNKKIAQIFQSKANISRRTQPTIAAQAEGKARIFRERAHRKHEYSQRYPASIERRIAQQARQASLRAR